MYTYEQVIDRIEHARRFGKAPGVEATARALAVLGQPQRGLPYIHVAGTNGKGSVCAFLGSILQTAGERVGVFTSPHLVDFEERITINGVRISRDDVARLGSLLLDTDFGIELTMFDYCLLMAVLYFRESGCTVAVMETGLGGRLDSTNALGTPCVAVITRIGLDHTAILGNTLAQIAAEKAGILKPGCTFVMGPQEPEAEAVLRDYANRAGLAEMYCVTPSDVAEMKSYPLRMLGEYQYENAAIARQAAHCYFSYIDKNKQDRHSIQDTIDRQVVHSGRQTVEQIIRTGLSRATWPGRMQILSEDPFLLVDGAHNPDGTAALRQSLMTLYPGERFHFLMGVMADKDYMGMITDLLPLAIDFHTVTVQSDRALAAEQLAAQIASYGVPATASPDLSTALHDTLSHKGRTVAFGSLYFVGEVMSAHKQA